MIKSRGPQPLDTRTGFWEYLGSFWTEDHVEKWRKAIFSNPSDPNDAVDSCENLITLNSYAHTIWNCGCFAFKPVRASDDGRELDLLFFWQPQHQLPPTVDLSLTPRSSKNLDCCRPDQFLHRRVNEGFDQLRSGDRIKLRTDDPKNHPLPSWDLLDMQWHLQRVVGMSGAADWPYENLDSDSDISSLKEMHPIEENDGPSFKRICLEGHQFPGASFRSFDGITEWISEPEDLASKEPPLTDLEVAAFSSSPGPR